MRKSAGLEIILSGNYGKYLLRAETYANEHASGCTILTIPGKDFWELVSSVTFRLSPDAEVSKNDLPYHAFVSDLHGNVRERKMKFSYRNVTMLEIECEKYVLADYRVAED